MFANDEFGKNIREFKKSLRTMNLEKIFMTLKKMFTNDEFGKNIRDFNKMFANDEFGKIICDFNKKFTNIF